MAEMEQVTAEFDGAIGSFMHLPVKHALPILRSTVDELGQGHGGSGKLDARQALLEETARQGRVDLLDALDAQLGETKEDGAVRRRIHVVVAEDWRDANMRRVRDSLARRHPESFPLAPYRPGGVAYLLDVLENRDASIEDRVASILSLGKRASTDVIARLAALADDPTEIPGVRGLPVPVGLAKLPTLGTYVRKAIEQIMRRAGE